MCYPKDSLAGGTWIGTSSKKRLVCLLNGGFGPHERLEEYRKSRGLIVKELLVATNTLAFLQTTNLVDIEPFTLISIDWKRKLELHQLIWDGHKKHLQKIPISPQIWSAPMLYSKEIKQNREILFRKFLIDNQNELGQKVLMEFHKKFKMDREFVQTTSITQFVRTNQTSEMIYKDLLTGKRDLIKINWE